jgi:hypothetical protein
MDYSIFYKDSFSEGNLSNLDSYDFFLSAYDKCERTLKTYENVKSAKKIWFIFPHYKINIQDYPKENVYERIEFKEDDFFLKFIEDKTINIGSNICIDITGFIRPHLIYLLKYISFLGIKKIDLLYSEPTQYKHADETTFSGFIDSIDPISGCSSANINPNTDNDLLIISAGYDDDLIAKVARNKSHCKKRFYILGFPSIQPDMYQESILKMENAKESIGENKQIRFAPAFDPFITAQVIDQIINENPDSTNIYLSPLSTKPQTIGMALYFMWNYNKHPLNIIFPYSKKYHTKLAIGIKRTWRYTFEFP